MPAINFQKRFAPLVERGEKCQTIRALRTDNRPPCAEGKPLKLYTGMRSKDCRLLKEVTVKRLKRIELHWNEAVISGERVAYSVALDNLAILDGFNDYSEMVLWFHETHGLPFAGWLIQW